MPAPLSPEVRARLQRVVKDRILPRFGGDPDRQQSEAARALKVHPSSLNRLVKHGTGGSVTMIEKIERMLNEPPGTILGYLTDGPSVPRFRDLPGFEAVLDEAEKRAREGKIQLSRRDLECAGDFRLSPAPARLTAEFLVQLALSVGDDEPPKKSRPKRKK